MVWMWRNTAMINWPTNPKEGDEFSYYDPIGGMDIIVFTYWMGSWQYVGIA